jgi:hypothetical protein
MTWTMPTQPQPEQIEKAVRRYTRKGLTTRQIVRMLANQGVHTSQSTVSRTRQKINSGPHPILPPGYRPPSRTRRVMRALRPAGATAALTVALILLAAVCVILIARPRAAATPARTPVPVCVSKGSALATAVPAGGCPAGWETVTLLDGGLNQ